MSHKLDVKS